ncbi:MAG: Xaa-Pro peptidase family protein [Peptococcaceae bacterium]|jgi:Xaa-Pro aminopeptidase|nr:Xaa-Pro peptidase family protein [Peptococcaceae bacterium]
MLKQGSDQSRIARLRRVMEADPLEGFVVFNPVNVRYLSGFTGTSGVLLITANQAVLLTDSRYLEQAEAQAGECQIVDIAGNQLRALESLIMAAQVETLAFEEDYLSFAAYGQMTQMIPGKRWLSRSELILRMRMVKDDEEIKRIRQAVAIADASFAQLLTGLKAGQREEEIALALEWYMRQAGASARSFDFIVASGWRSAMPHGVASTKELADGELLTLDFGAVYAGYCSDITRTLCLSRADDRQRAIYEIVLAANRAGIAALKPGISGREADAAARCVITEAGYGEQFGHGLGHSLGLEIHERPNLNRSEEQLLEPGMLVTVEPGIYLPGWGGVRIEDLVLVTQDGCEVLTQAPKEFIIIE